MTNREDAARALDRSVSDKLAELQKMQTALAAAVAQLQAQQAEVGQARQNAAADAKARSDEADRRAKEREAVLVAREQAIAQREAAFNKRQDELTVNALVQLLTLTARQNEPDAAAAPANSTLNSIPAARASPSPTADSQVAQLLRAARK